MDVKLQYPFESVNVVVDCGGGRVDGPNVHISIVNGAVDAKKSAVVIEGEYHLHPFQAGPTPSDSERTKALAVAACDDIVLHLRQLDLRMARECVAVRNPTADLVEKVQSLRDICSGVSAMPTITGDDPVKEQAFKELVALVIAKLVELTPATLPFAHHYYSVTNNDLVANAVQIVAQLKDSPWLAAIIKTLLPTPVPYMAKKSPEDDLAASLSVEFFQACAAVERGGGHEDAADRFDEFSQDKAFCLAVANKMMEDTK